VHPEAEAPREHDEHRHERPFEAEEEQTSRVSEELDHSGLTCRAKRTSVPSGLSRNDDGVAGL
jgi:hypothetical protein